MIQDPLSRRTLVLGGAAIVATWPIGSLARTTGPVMHVVKDPNCGCCSAWIDILERDGFRVTTEASTGTQLMRYKFENGIPQTMVSCHTGRVDGYMIEGHVPVADIRRLLEERPNAVGLAVPGMPYGSPGMGPASEREAYDVFLIDREGRTDVFSHYESA
ncbi:MAG: DUF411 domain-containing protein [Roseovarius sp.]|uniref:DUF411 domain-containing protein n=1 Tax=Roseovarius sp. TaxID=1486281 RepID=UPI0019863296|nr:DUF411 domain-containing protein [Roseovarius sp.]MBC7179730.1 DUF411 domain-containing protein [Roseovarius sp.]MBQ0751881.1 DUF411 domain-containing protein [Roseovarius sp.]MBQ0812528.1 DUF411 domain-containing protein [Roseovarius sp.]